MRLTGVTGRGTSPSQTLLMTQEGSREDQNPPERAHYPPVVTARLEGVAEQPLCVSCATRVRTVPDPVAVLTALGHAPGRPPLAKERVRNSI